MGENFACEHKNGGFLHGNVCLKPIFTQAIPFPVKVKYGGIEIL